MAPNIGQGSSTTPDRGYELFITATVMVIIAGLFVVTRVAVRLTSNKLGTDDYVIMLSLVSSPCFSWLATRHGDILTPLGIFSAFDCHN